MRVLVATQGEWGERIAQHLVSTAPASWAVVTWSAPRFLPAVLDDPEEFVPRVLPRAELLVLLTESPGLTDLAPDVADVCGARAVIVAVDRRSCARPGLRRQVQRRLVEMGRACTFAMPFCSLKPAPNQHAWVRAFAERYGLPELACAVAGERIVSCAIVREAPCGNTRYIAERLAGAATEDAVEQAGLLHHYYPCWGGMEADPVTGQHTLLHVAATIAGRSVARALQRSQPVVQ